ncbi:trypsin-like peptidase domain-containing protein [Sulfurovum sp.]|jgi:S1-C subfamily serine protease|uniref:S1C family serine protease n=1 Tax=Sulfurovum sp. TaxID=1969726 RepID=UPI002A36B7AE|nr:trypsin-like peptidase domain-containing protein [Sulfurovum sp.]MDD2451965.1 trypsin-like peptidase domain-containing protein [Sulfurovum sp.]MDD3500451.1 trypsin-like peptidase domain-containing protein [Sulfurovum sp.]MDY0401838.1 trypsin-like peptidase domain-containing protein [Sulfurovum sp.]
MDNAPMQYRLLRTIRTLLFILIGLIALLFLLPRLETLWLSMHTESRAVTARGALSDTERTNIEIFRQASPSVVYITTLTDTFNLWTRDITRIPRGTGSGFVWDRYGHIITNYHVLEGASEIRIHLSDRRMLSAVLVGASADHDIAVLRIPMVSNMPAPLPIGTSSDLKVGQMMYAIGNPFGLDQTLTTGVVSALNRSLYNDNGSQIKGLIQTDAAINPGNSGGPLLDSAGRLVGINTAIYSPSGVYAGIGFAVPVDTVNRIVPRLIAKGHYRRPRLGITIDDELNKAITGKLGIKGVAVIGIREGSPAHRAGLRSMRMLSGEGVRVGDIILSINGEEVDTPALLLDTLEKYHSGDRIKLQYLRENEVKSTMITLE